MARVTKRSTVLGTVIPTTGRVPGTFTIQELGRVGSRSGFRPDGGEGEVFEWVASGTPPNAAKGGARAIPKQAWMLGGEMRTVRTDYPGAKTPSEQVLGPMHADQQFTGRWDDRYNFEGYAIEELKRFEAMVRRGNLVRISFQEITFECLIKKWEFAYKRDWYIGYSFTTSVHNTPDAYSIADRSPSTTQSSQEAFEAVDRVVKSMLETMEEAPTSELSEDTLDVVKASVASTVSSRNSLADTLDQRELGSFGNDPVSPFTRIATQFRTVGEGARDILDQLTAVRSDLHLGVVTATSMLNFESWSRSMRFESRVLLGQSQKAGQEMDERAKPNATRLYRPHRGESLYAISRRFYGTPHSWRLIADRNALPDFELTGDELLIIPERGRG